MSRKIVKNFLEEFLYGDHLVGLAATGMALSVVLSLGLRINLLLLFIEYLTYLIVYAYNHFRELSLDVKSNPERVAHIEEKRTLRKRILVFYLLILYLFLLFANWDVALLVTFVLVGGVLYTEYFKQRPILGIKNYYAAFYWSLTAVLVPLFYGQKNVFPYLFLAVFILLRVFLNTVFFDIKDIKADKENNVKTFPSLIGKKKTIYFLFFINLISLIPLLSGIYFAYLPYVVLFYGLTVIHGIYYLFKALSLDERNLRFLSYVLLDGEYIFWPLMIFIGKLFI